MKKISGRGQLKKRGIQLYDLESLSCESSKKKKKIQLGAETTQQGKNLRCISAEETLPPDGLQEKVVQGRDCKGQN